MEQSSPGARIICEGYQHKRHPGNIGVQEFALDLVFGELIKSLKADASLLEAWEAQQRQAQDSSRERLLQKRLDSIETKEKEIPARREQAFELLSDTEAAVKNQAKKMIAQLDSDEAALAAEKEAVLLLLSSASSPRTTQNTTQELQGMLARAAQSWPKFSNERKNEVARALCQAVNSFPRLYRAQERYPVEAVVSWPEVLPNALYPVLYGKGIAPKVETITKLPRRKKARELPANVTAIGLAK